MGSKLLPLACLAAVVQLIGCGAPDAVAPTDAASLSLATGASPVIGATLPVFEYPGSSSGVSGEATLTRAADGVWADQDFEGLTPGYAYTIWIVVFDNPLGCVASTCAPSDLARPQAQGSLVNGGGFVAEGSSMSYASHLARHDVEGQSVQMGDPSGVDNTYGAQIHLVLRNHGTAEADAANRAIQTSTFNGFCNLAGGCANVAAAVFDPPHAPGRGE
jgi:hypothetical protein